MQAKITKRTVDGTVATEGDLWVWDTELKGFGLRVRSSGRKTYVVEYRPGAGGRKAPKRRYVIGQHGSPWTPDTARAEARRILGAVGSGADPVADRADARRREGTTVEEVAAVYIERYAKVHQRSWRQTERTFLKDVNPAIGRMRIQDVTKADVLALLDAVAERAPIMANSTHAHVRGFFRWCVERGYITENPAAGLTAPAPKTARDRVLDDGELAEVWWAAESVGGPWGAIVKVLILTAQRLGEVAGIRWAELNLDTGLWGLPGNRTKNGSAHEVPLVGSAVAILRAVPQMAGSPFVFTSTGVTPTRGESKAKLRLDLAINAERKKEGREPMPHWTFHDIRRTATTGMARLGIHPHVADAILNHKGGTITGVAAVYNRHAYTEERRRALEAWERHVLALLEGKPAAGNVVALRSATGNIM